MNPKYRRSAGPAVSGKKKEKEVLGIKRGDLSEALELLKNERKTRTIDDESPITKDELLFPEGEVE